VPVPRLLRHSKTINNPFTLTQQNCLTSFVLPGRESAKKSVENVVVRVVSAAAGRDGGVPQGGDLHPTAGHLLERNKPNVSTEIVVPPRRRSVCRLSGLRRPPKRFSAGTP